MSTLEAFHTKCLKIEEFYNCDYRVRLHIAHCLDEPLQIDNEYRINFRLQNALCYYIGFGVPQDQVHALEILSSIRKLKSDLDALGNKSRYPSPR